LAAPNGDLIVNGNIEARGGGFGGGRVSLEARTSLTVNRPVRATATGVGSGGDIFLTCGAGDITVNATVDASPGGDASTGGRVRVDTCGLEIGNNGSLLCTDPNSQNVVLARDDVCVAGTMRSTVNTFRLHPAAPLPNSRPGCRAGNVVPTPAITRDSTLPGCGTPSVTPTRTRTPTRVRTPSSTPTVTWTPSITRTPTITATFTPCNGTCPPTLTPSPTPTPTRPIITCTGDCNGDGEVTIDELIRGVRLALNEPDENACPAFDANGDGEVTIEELVAAVNNALVGCPVPG
jgi:hypothetical protein